MTKKTRNILFIIFILLFFTITPLVCLYAAGYKLGKNFSIQKTGILIVETKPKGANVILDLKAQQNFVANILTSEEIYTSPTKIKNLLPGEYNIKLEKANYLPWEKKIKINSGESFYIENIILFKNDRPSLIKDGEYNFLEPSRDKKYILAANDTQAALITTSDNALSEITWNEKIDNITWSNGNNFLINKKLFNISQINNKIDLTKDIGNNAANIQFDQSDSSQIYFQDGKSLVNFNLNNQSSKTIIDNLDVVDYFVNSNNLYFISNENNNINFNIYRVKNSEYIRKISFPTAKYAFWNKDSNYINLYNVDRNTLYIISPLAEINPIIATIDNVNKSYWLDDKKLIYANDFEIWSLNLDNNNKNLLTRISEPITTLLPTENQHYLFFATNNKINFIERDWENNITQLIGLDKIQNPFFFAKENIIYFISTIDNKNGVYKLTI